MRPHHGLPWLALLLLCLISSGAIAAITIETVDSGVNDVGQYASISVTPSGGLAIAYYDATTQDLKFATKSGSSWSKEVVESSGNVGTHASLAIDPQGGRNIAYYDSDRGSLKYAGHLSFPWAIASENVEEAPSQVGQYCSLTIDEQGRPAVAYYDEVTADVKFATKSGTQWSKETVESSGSVGTHCALAIDSTGRRNLSYYDADRGSLKYAGWVQIPWTASLEQVETGFHEVGLYASITIDNADRPAVTYYDETTFDLRFALKSGLTWSSETVDATGSIGTHCALAIDPSGRRNISYYDADRGSLKYAGWVQAPWTASLERVETSFHEIGQYASITVDDSNRPAVAYYDETTFDLRFALKDGSTWANETVDATGSIGTHCALAIDPSGRRNISYYDADRGSLKYAGWIQSPIQALTEIVDPALNDVGQYASLTRLPAGGLVASYYDATTKDLKFTERIGSAWQSSKVAEADPSSNLDVGSHSSVCAPTSGDVLIAYYDATNGDLKLASGYREPPPDLDPPAITGTTDLPDTDDTAGPYQVTSTVTDASDILYVLLKYRVGTSGAFTPMDMSPVQGSDRYTAPIPGQPTGSTVQYYIQAADEYFNTALDPPGAPASLFSFAVTEHEPEEWQLGSIVLRASTITGVGTGTITATGDVSINGFLRLTGTVTITESTYQLSGNGRIFVDSLPEIDELTLYEGSYSVGLDGVAGSLLNFAAQGAVERLRLGGFPIAIDGITLQPDGACIEGLLVMPPGWSSGGLMIDNLCLTRSEGLTVEGEACTPAAHFRALTLENTCLTFDTANDVFGGHTGIRTALFAASGSMEFQSGCLDDIALAFSVNHGIPLGTSGLQLVGGAASVANMCGISGNLIIHGGVDIASVAGIGDRHAFELSDAGLTVEVPAGFSAGADVKVFGEHLGHGELGYMRGKFSLQSSMSMPEEDPWIIGESSLTVWAEADALFAEGAMRASVQIPDFKTHGLIEAGYKSLLELFLGPLPQDLGGVELYSTLRTNPMRFRTEGMVHLEMPGESVLSLAMRVDIAEETEVYLGQNYKSLFQISNARGVPKSAGAELTFPIGHGSNQVLFIAAPPIPFSLITPSGEVWTPETVPDRQKVFVTVPEFSCYVVTAPAAGNWQVVLADDGEEHEVHVLGQVQIPATQFTRPARSGVTDGMIEWIGSDADSAWIEVSYDDDAQGGDGIRLFGPALLASESSYHWDGAGAAPGTYNIYAKVWKRGTPPSIVYAPGTIAISHAGSPPKPTGLTASTSDSSVVLSWNPVGGDDILGYEVRYRPDAAGSPDILTRAVPDTSTVEIVVPQVGQPYRFAVAAYDSAFAFGPESDPVTATVVAVSQKNPPAIHSYPPTNAIAGTSWAYQVEATDVDPGTVLQYSLGEHPSSMAVNPTTGNTNWLPTDDDAGLVPVVVRVSDGEHTTEQSFQILVQRSPASVGIVALDASMYSGPNAVGLVTVTDANLDRSAAADTAHVRLTSHRDPTGILLLLREVSPRSGMFAGAFGVVDGASEESARLISARDRDTLRVAYSDETPPAERIAEARFLRDPTPVFLSFLEGVVADHAVVLTWGVPEGIDLLGYLVLRRSDSSDWVRLTESPIIGRSGLEYTDRSVVGGIEYEYAIEGISASGERLVLGTIRVVVPISRSLSLQVHPAPARSIIRGSLYLPTPSTLRLDLYDVSGRHEATVLSGDYPAGLHPFAIDTRGPDGERIRSGVHYLRVTCDSGTWTTSLVLVK